MALTPQHAQVRVNDVHSGLNETVVDEIVAARTRADLVSAVERARTSGRHVAVCGGRHAMGGQQFGAGAVLIDTAGMNQVHAFDSKSGLVEVDAGIQWPHLVAWLLRAHTLVDVDCWTSCPGQPLRPRDIYNSIIAKLDQPVKLERGAAV